MEITVFHVFKDEHPVLSLRTHAVQVDDVLVLESGQQLGLSLEVSPQSFAAVSLECLDSNGCRAFLLLQVGALSEEDQAEIALSDEASRANIFW